MICNFKTNYYLIRAPSRFYCKYEHLHDFYHVVSAESEEKQLQRELIEVQNLTWFGDDTTTLFLLFLIFNAD